MEVWIKNHARGSTLALSIQPGAGITCLTGIHGDRLKVKVQAPPIDGKANAAVLDFFGKLLGVGKRRVHLLQGESSRQKLLLVELPVPDVLTIILKQLQN